MSIPEGAQREIKASGSQESDWYFKLAQLESKVWFQYDELTLKWKVSNFNSGWIMCYSTEIKGETMSIPEGATHYINDTDIPPLYYKHCGLYWQYYNESGGYWLKSSEKDKWFMNNLTEIKGETMSNENERKVKRFTKSM